LYIYILKDPGREGEKKKETIVRYYENTCDEVDEVTNIRRGGTLIEIKYKDGTSIIECVRCGASWKIKNEEENENSGNNIKKE